MKRIIILSAFDRSVRKLSPLEKTQLSESLEQFRTFVFRGVKASGFGFKKIGDDIYEFRVGLRLRVIILAEGNTYYLALVGNHDEVKKYLRHYR
jgi:hypothetical protein